MLRVYGIEVDVIEVFVYHVLVQEPSTGMIYLVLLSDLEEIDPTETENDGTNILSMKGWEEWRKNQGKQKFQKSKNKKNKRPKPNLRLICYQQQKN